MIGNDVKMRGVKIGVVSDVKLDKEYFALIDFQIYSKIKIPRESNIKIASDGILEINTYQLLHKEIIWIII